MKRGLGIIAEVEAAAEAGAPFVPGDGGGEGAVPPPINVNLVAVVDAVLHPQVDAAVNVAERDPVLVVQQAAEVVAGGHRT